MDPWDIIGEIIIRALAIVGFAIIAGIALVLLPLWLPFVLVYKYDFSWSESIGWTVIVTVVWLIIGAISKKS